MSENVAQDVRDCLNYKNAVERDKVKQYFTNPSQINKERKTIIWSTPSETGTSYFRLFEPMKAIFRHFPDEFNLIYTENLC